jgi:hypothetical protein
MSSLQFNSARNFASNLFFDLKILTMTKLTLIAAFCCVLSTFAKATTVPAVDFSANHYTLPKEFDFSVVSLSGGSLILKVKSASNEDAYIYIENNHGIPVTTTRVRLEESDETMVMMDISELKNQSYRITLAASSKKVSKTIILPNK